VAAINSHGMATSASGYLRVTSHDLLRGGEHWEKGWNGWETDGSVWEVGMPSGGPGPAYQGNNVVATTLAGSYPAYSQTRLTSPQVELPGLAPGEELQLRIEHWFNYSSYDSGTVQI